MQNSTIQGRMVLLLFCSFNYTTKQLLNFADHAAGNFLSSIAGRLGVKVIGITVYDHSPSDNIRHRKPIRSYGQIRIPLTLQQWRQVTCVFWMRLVRGIIVAARTGKVSSGTVIALMNVKAKKPVSLSLGRPEIFATINTHPFSW